MDWCYVVRIFRIWIFQLLIKGCLSQGFEELGIGTRIGVIIGCALGGIVLIVLIVLFICICRRPNPEKKTPVSEGKGTAIKNGTPEYYASSNHSGSVQSNNNNKMDPGALPPGIWTSNPTMFAGAPSPATYFYSNQPPPPPIVQNGTLQSNGSMINGMGNGYVNGGMNGGPPPGPFPVPYGPPPPPLSNPTLERGKPWYKNTISRARKVLGSLPSVFQVKKSGKPNNAFDTPEQVSLQKTSKNRHHYQSKGTFNAKMLIPDETVRVRDPVYQKLPDQFHQSDHNSTMNSDSSAHALADDFTNIPGDFNIPGAIAEVDPPSRNNEEGRFVAKAYSNYSGSVYNGNASNGTAYDGVVQNGYTKDNKGAEDDTDDSTIARVYSSHNNIRYSKRVERLPDPVANNTHRSNTSANSVPKITQSDWALHVKSKPVARAQSNFEKGGAGQYAKRISNGNMQGHGSYGSSSQMSARPYGRGVYMRPPSDIQLSGSRTSLVQSDHQPSKKQSKFSKKKDKTHVVADVVRMPSQRAPTRESIPPPEYNPSFERPTPQSASRPAMLVTQEHINRQVEAESAPHSFVHQASVYEGKPRNVVEADVTTLDLRSSQRDVTSSRASSSRHSSSSSAQSINVEEFRRAQANFETDRSDPNTADPPYSSVPMRPPAATPVESRYSSPPVRPVSSHIDPHYDSVPARPPVLTDDRDRHVDVHEDVDQWVTAKEPNNRASVPDPDYDTADWRKSRPLELDRKSSSKPKNDNVDSIPEYSTAKVANDNFSFGKPMPGYNENPRIDYNKPAEQPIYAVPNKYGKKPSTKAKEPDWVRNFDGPQENTTKSPDRSPSRRAEAPDRTSRQPERTSHQPDEAVQRQPSTRPLSPTRHAPPPPPPPPMPPTPPASPPHTSFPAPPPPPPLPPNMGGPSPQPPPQTGNSRDIRRSRVASTDFAAKGAVVTEDAFKFLEDLETGSQGDMLDHRL